MMMKISTQRHKKRFNPWWAVTGLLVALVILFFLPLPGFIAGTAQTIGGPLLGIETGISNFFSPLSNYFAGKRAQAAHIAALEEEVARLQLEGLRNVYFRYENEQLRAALEGRGTESTPVKFGAVLAGPPRSLYDTLVISVGSGKGVKKGALVTTPRGVALGTISSLGKESSVVTLFSAPEIETRVAIMTGSTSPHSIAAKGKGGGSFEIQLPREITVGEGNPIVLPGAPPIILGKIERIIADPTSAYQSILFTYAENIFELRYVLVGEVPEVPHEFGAPIETHKEVLNE